MSAYPPPPPPPQQSPNAYNRAVWKAQRRAAKQQASLLREQARQQRRMARPRSVIGPLIIVLLGILILLAQLGRISLSNVAEWYARWWPLVLVAAGVILLAEWALDSRGRSGTQPYRRRALGGGTIFLLSVLISLGITSRAAYQHFHWGDGQYGFVLPSFDEAFGEEHDFDSSLSSGIDPAATLIVRNPYGDVTITGSSEDGQVHVSVHKVVHTRTYATAASREASLEPSFIVSGGDLVLNVPSLNGGHADLTIQLPRTTGVTVNANRGDVSVQELHAAVSISGNNGDVELSGIDGAITVHLNDRRSSFTSHSTTGNLRVDGHGDDVTISDVTGSAIVAGDFFGDTHLEHVSGTMQFQSIRTQFSAARLDGTFDINNQDLEASQVVGPIVLITKHGKNITFSQVQGDIQVSNEGGGSISLTSTSPLGQVDINNSQGSVDVGIPAASSFTVSAQTRHGSIENDFDLKKTGTDDLPQLDGAVGSGKPHIHIVTADGDITLRKASVAPLPPAPPQAPHITITPPPEPAEPKVPVKPQPPASNSRWS
jgi:DUF4097 and DUF4098 domain-containing protein YvlB